VDSSPLPTLHQIHTILDATGRADLPEARPVDVCIDSRACRPGSLFVALPGEVTDGHRFVAAAHAAGAIAAIVRAPHDEDGAPWPLPVVVVPDALVALQQLAAWYVTEHLLETVRVGITGSNGKTTTKEILAAVLRTRYEVFASRGNLNSETGLPLSVLSTPPGVACAVYEMAMSNPGEMAPLARIVRPSHAVITNIGTAHIGQLGSRRAIADEKRQIAAAFTGVETLYIPEDDDFREVLAADVRGTVALTGPGTQEASLSAVPDGVAIALDGHRGVLPLRGVHNGRNGLVAIAVAVSLGVPAADALAALTDVRLPDGRSQVLSLGEVTVLNDSYNANPGSMVAAIEMAESMGATVLVLGDMYELGEFEAAGHREVLQAALSSSARAICLVGPRFRTIAEEDPGAASPSRVSLADSIEGAATVLQRIVAPGDTVLLKGSRAVALERLIPVLEKGATSRA